MPQTTAVSTDTPAPITKMLAEFAAAVTLPDLLDRTVTAGSCCLLDWLACVIAGNGDAATLVFRDYAEHQGARGVARILGTDASTSAELAALVNGAAAHVHDFDDTHLGMYGHPSAAVISAVFAAAERDDADGSRLHEAIIAAVEATSRLGVMLGYNVYLKGFTPASNSGAIGSAIGSAMIKDASAGHIRTAIGAVAGMASGLHCNGSSGAGFLQIGAAAAAGIRAADMALLGVSTIPDIIECQKGFVASRSDTISWDRDIGELGRPFEIDRIAFKFHAACGGVQAAIEAARSARQKGVNADQIDGITVTVSPTVNRLCRYAQPTNGAEAKLSLPFGIAAALSDLRTGDIGIYAQDTITRPDIHRLMTATRIIEDAEIPEWETRLSLDGAFDGTGEFVARVDAPVEDLDLLWDKLSEKFLILTAPVIGEEKARLVPDLVRNRASARDIVAAIT